VKSHLNEVKLKF